MIKGFIFDLDGVLVDTARFHFKAWKKLANSIDIDFTEEQNEKLKGVGREESLRKILSWGNKEVAQETFEELMHQKNQRYLEMVDAMTKDDILPGVRDFLNEARRLNLKIALGSASKNAPKILNRVEITHFFDAVIDGNHTTKSKPDPQVFVMGAEALKLSPDQLVVFEDSQAGIEAANTGGFKSIGIGTSSNLPEAHKVYSGLENLHPEELINELN